MNEGLDVEFLSEVPPVGQRRIRLEVSTAIVLPGLAAVSVATCFLYLGWSTVVKEGWMILLALAPVLLAVFSIPVLLREHRLLETGTPLLGPVLCCNQQNKYRWFYFMANQNTASFSVEELGIRCGPPLLELHQYVDPRTGGGALDYSRTYSDLALWRARAEIVTRDEAGQLIRMAYQDAGRARRYFPRRYS